MKNRRAITPRTQICAIIGDPVAHSLSPAIHNAAFAALDLDFVYVAFRVADVAAALGGMRALENFRGMSVTIPHKTEAMKYVDRVAEVDRHIGSINTVIHTEVNDKRHLFLRVRHGRAGGLKSHFRCRRCVAGKCIDVGCRGGGPGHCLYPGARRRPGRH
ncbi:MAG: hypothetical protein R2861_04360 [Desulfobacterales bacterium]